jgi:hypothetical protein
MLLVSRNVVLFTCFVRYSKRAMDILAQYDLVPQPKIIEVDLRGA